MPRRDLPPGLAGLKARLVEWLRAHRQSDAQFARQTGLSEATVRRLVQQPAYQSTVDTWRVVARTCGWSEAEVLQQAGFLPPGPVPAHGWALVEQGLTELGVPAAKQAAIRGLLNLDQPTPLRNHSAANTDGS